MNTHIYRKINDRFRDLRVSASKLMGIGSVILLMSVVSAGVHAFEFDTGNPDLSIRWDNTLKYNLKFRAQDLNPAIPGPTPANPAFPLLGDDADLGYEQWDIVFLSLSDGTRNGTTANL
jgi:hypothetical protein